MIDWLTTLAELERRGEQSVLVTVAETRGSAPREAGTKMVVSAQACYGTIGGGNLEFRAIEIGRALLVDGNGASRRLERFPLGPALGQCCGGAATLLFERIATPLPAWARALLDHHDPAVLVGPADAAASPEKIVVWGGGSSGSLGEPALDEKASAAARELLQHEHVTRLRELETGAGSSIPLLFEPVRGSDVEIVLFGAGHVGRALVQVLAGLPCRITWVDPRPDQFPDLVPGSVTIAVRGQPEDEIDRVPPGSYVLIMTHSHALDQAITERALRRDDLAYCGLIGSITKLRKFQKRMMARGLPAPALDRLTCPIGVPGITGKHPSEIAVAVAAQLLQVRERQAAEAWLSAQRCEAATDELASIP